MNSKPIVTRISAHLTSLLIFFFTEFSSFIFSDFFSHFLSRLCWPVCLLERKSVGWKIRLMLIQRFDVAQRNPFHSVYRLRSTFPRFFSCSRFVFFTLSNQREKYHSRGNKINWDKLENWKERTLSWDAWMKIVCKIICWRQSKHCSAAAEPPLEFISFSRRLYGIHSLRVIQQARKFSLFVYYLWWRKIKWI